MPTPVRAVRPTFYVESEEKRRLAEGLMELSILEATDGLRSLSATFGNWGEVDGSATYLYDDRALLDFGKQIEVRFDQDVVFKGRIYGLEGAYPEGAPPTLTVLAEDALQDLRMTRRTRSFEDITDADLFSQVAQDHGLSADVDAPGPTFPHLAQLNQSDLAFLRARALLAGVELWLDEDSLHAAARPTRAGEAVTLRRGEDLRSFRVCADLSHQATAVAVSGWSRQDKEAVRHEADDGVLGDELGDDESGAAALQRARGARVQTLQHTLPLTAEEAQAEAEAAFRTIARRFVTGEGVAQGDARLRVGRKVTLEGLGRTFDGAYVIVEVDHRFDAENGLRTELRVERPGVGEAS